MKFFKKHPIISNLLLMLLLLVVVIWGVLKWLHHYTNHDKSVEVPKNLSGLTVEQASKFFQQNKLNYQVADSGYQKNATPGTISKTIPPEGSRVKEGRTIYITTYSYNPPSIGMPDIVDMSQRQALALLKSIGFERIEVKYIDGIYKDLVLGLETKGQTIKAGERYPNNIPLTLLVSSGSSTFDDSNVEFSEVEDVIEIVPEESWF